VHLNGLYQAVTSLAASGLPELIFSFTLGSLWLHSTGTVVPQRGLGPVHQPHFAESRPHRVQRHVRSGSLRNVASRLSLNVWLELTLARVEHATLLSQYNTFTRLTTVEPVLPLLIPPENSKPAPRPHLAAILAWSPQVTVPSLTLPSRPHPIRETWVCSLAYSRTSLARVPCPPDLASTQRSSTTKTIHGNACIFLYPRPWGYPISLSPMVFGPQLKALCTYMGART
jgi:hypothetical protein